MEIIYTKKFISEYKKLPRNIRLLLIEKEKMLKGNIFDPKLKTHKLTGKLRGNLAFSINYQYRVIFYIENTKEVWFLSTGTHNIYRN